MYSKAARKPKKLGGQKTDIPTYLESTLRGIREKRLSYDAAAKGVFPNRTPSRPLSPPKKKISVKKDAIFQPDRPTLSLTKLDFELLKEWDWKERHKRLESWGNDLGITKTHKHFKRPDLQEDYESLNKRRHRRKSKKDHMDVTSRAILKRELEHLTGLKVYAPGESTAHYSHKERAFIKELGHFRAQDKTGHEKKHSTEDHGIAQHHKEESIPVDSGVRQANLNSLMEKADESKITFRKRWGASVSAATAITHKKNRSMSATLASSDDNSLHASDTSHTHHDHHSHHHHHHMYLGSSHHTDAGQHSHHAHHDHIHHDHSHSHHDHSHHHDHIHSGHHHHHRTDIEEEQPNTDYSTQTPSHKSTRAPTTVTRPITREGSSSPSTPTDSAASIGINDLFRGIRKSFEEENKSDDSDDKVLATAGKEEHAEKYQRPNQPVEYQDTCFGGITFVDRAAVKPMSKMKNINEFYMTFDDNQLGLGKAMSKSLKIKFLKSELSKGGRSEKILEKKKAEKLRKKLEKEEEQKLRDKIKKMSDTHNELLTQEQIEQIKNFAERPDLNVQSFVKEFGRSRTERLIEFEKALMSLPGISSAWQIRLSLSATHPSEMHAVGRISKRSQFTRPPRRIWYTPLPLTVKKYYRTNWKKIRVDIRQLMKEKQFWPKLWINFEESHPKKLYELIRAKLAVKDFDRYGFKRVFDWGRGVHPDYIDWIIEDIVPHPGRYYYSDDHGDAVRRASVEEADIRLREWFVKPPRYIPDTPLSPPFDRFDFCGYGNREKPFFLAFTLPREILHYHAPPSKIQKFFRNIPKPPNAYPGYTFKRWLNYPLEQKLPQYYPFPKRFMTWTRGKVGEPVQCNSSRFYNDDPYIKKRDAGYSPYHDAHTRGYILRKDILDRIWELGIINSKGEVMCTMAEFNKNRLYLRDHEWVEETLRRWNLRWNDRQEQNRLTKYTNYIDLDWEGKNKMWESRLQESKKYRKIRDKNDKEKFQKINEKTKKSVEAAEKYKEKLRQEMIERAIQKRNAQIQRKKTVTTLESIRKLQLQRNYEKKDEKAQRHRKRHFLEKVADRLEQQKESWKRHVEFHRMKMAHVQRLEIELEKEFRMKVQMHKKKVRAKWKDVPYSIIRNKILKNYEYELARKYGYIWLEKVREKKKYLPDERHLSIWTGGRHMHATVLYLKDVSGYMDVDTFLSTMFKRILQQRELEDHEQHRPKGRRRSPSTEERDDEAGDREDDDDEEVYENNYLESAENSDIDLDDHKSDQESGDGYDGDKDDDFD